MILKISILGLAMAAVYGAAEVARTASSYVAVSLAAAEADATQAAAPRR